MLHGLILSSQHCTTSLVAPNNPFSHFLKSSKVVKNIQDVINLVWPSTDYKIQWLDAACSKVRGVSPWFCMTL